MLIDAIIAMVLILVLAISSARGHQNVGIVEAEHFCGGGGVSLFHLNHPF